MAAISLFGDTNMAAVTSCEIQEYKRVQSFKNVKKARIYFFKKSQNISNANLAAIYHNKKDNYMLVFFPDARTGFLKFGTGFINIVLIKRHFLHSK